MSKFKEKGVEVRLLLTTPTNIKKSYLAEKITNKKKILELLFITGLT